MAKRILDLSNYWLVELDAAELDGERDADDLVLTDGPAPERKPQPKIDDDEDLVIV